MGFNPSMDMCDLNKKRTIAQKCVYHLKWAGVVVGCIVLFPVIIIHNGIQYVFDRKD